MIAIHCTDEESPPHVYLTHQVLVGGNVAAEFQARRCDRPQDVLRFAALALALSMDSRIPQPMNLLVDEE